MNIQKIAQLAVAQYCLGSWAAWETVHPICAFLDKDGAVVAATFRNGNGAVYRFMPTPEGVPYYQMSFLLGHPCVFPPEVKRIGTSEQAMATYMGLLAGNG